MYVVAFNGLRPRGLKHGARDVGEAAVLLHIGMFRGVMGRMASSVFFLKK